MSAACRVMRGQGAQAVLGALKKRKQIQQEQAQQEQETQDLSTSPEPEPTPTKAKPTLMKLEPKHEPALRAVSNQKVISEDLVSEQVPEQDTEQVTPEQSLSGPMQPVSKKRLLQQFLEMKGKKNLVMSMAYLPPPLDQIVGDIAHKRGKGVTRSHLFIESLLLHPDVLQELKTLGLLK